MMFFLKWSKKSGIAQNLGSFLFVLRDEEILPYH